MKRFSILKKMEFLGNIISSAAGTLFNTFVRGSIRQRTNTDSAIEYKGLDQVAAYHNHYNRERIGTKSPFLFKGRNEEFRTWKSGKFREKEEILLSEYNVVKAVDVISIKTNTAQRLICKLQRRDLFVPIELDVFDSWIYSFSCLCQSTSFVTIFETWGKKDPQHYYLCAFTKESDAEGETYSVRVSRYNVEVIN